MSKSTTGRRRGLATLATTALVAGACVAGAGAATADAGFKFDRIGGSDRYHTAALVDEAYGKTADAIIANGEPGNYADALTANYLSGVKNAPILLTKADSMPDITKQQLKDAGVQNVFIVGGTDVVSASQEQALKAAGLNVTRVAGKDRFETDAKAIAMGGNAKRTLGVIATGFNFPDALAGGPIAYTGSPLGLASKTDIDDNVIASLKAAGVTHVVILGGTDAVSPAVAAKLEANGIKVDQRLAGADRADTSVAVAKYATSTLGFTKTAVNVASGYVKGYGADALAGGPLTGKQNRPLLVTKDVNIPGASVLQYLKDNASTLHTGIIFGLEKAVSVTAQDQMEKAAQTPSASATKRPELTSASIVSTTTASQVTPDKPAGTLVSYTFDEDVLSAGAPPRVGNFHVYTSDGTPATANTVVSVSGNTVTVRYNAINTTEGAAALTVATVDRNAVSDTSGDVNPEGDAAIGTSSGGGATALPAGVTDAPDLVSVGNFRQGANAGETAVDFTFDQPAFVNNNQGFALVLLAGANGQPDDNQVDCTGPTAGTPATGAGSTPSGGTIAGGNGTKTITVVCTGPGGKVLTAADVARATVDANTVSDVQQADTDPSTVTGNSNPLQSADVSNGGNTAEPDLVSIDLRPSTNGSNNGNDAALFTFDQPVTTAASAGSFHLYTTDGQEESGTGTPQVNTNGDSRQVLVNFADLANVVGGNVVDDAVIAGASPTNLTPDGNEQDEVGVAGSTTTAPSQTAGRTAGPDLTAVSIGRGASDVFGNPGSYQATYTFDEPVTNGITNGKFFLYLADGTRLQATNCTRGAVTSGADRNDNTVTCTAYVLADATGTPAATSDQIGSAVLGTVDDGAATDGTAANPEGAEFTSGGTGTPTA